MVMEDPEDPDITAMFDEVEQHMQATQTEMNALMMSDEWDSDDDVDDWGGDGDEGDHQEEAMELEEPDEELEELEDVSEFGSPSHRPGLLSPRPRSPSYTIRGAGASSPGSGSEFSVQLGPPPHDFQLALANGNVAVKSVTPSGAAARVGLRAGDTIVRWAGVEIEGNGEKGLGEAMVTMNNLKNYGIPEMTLVLRRSGSPRGLPAPPPARVSVSSRCDPHFAACLKPAHVATGAS